MAEADYLRVTGHEELRERLARAAREGRFPQSLLLHGPRGVGKQRLALWSAAALLCRDDGDRPCGRCRACRLTARLEHPDVHWFFPTPRPKRASSPEKLRERLEDLRAEALAERRRDPHYLHEDEGATGIYLGAVHTMSRTAQAAPAMGPRKVIIVGQAEALIPQAGTAEAANALLKLLEEPPADTTVILTTDVPGALLPTTRSRMQEVRVPPLPTETVRDFLIRELELDRNEAGSLAAASAGSIGRALSLQGEAHEELRGEAVTLVRAALDGRQVARLAVAHGYRFFGARGAYGRMLGEASRLLRDLLAAATGAASAVVDREAVTSLTRDSTPDVEPILRTLQAIEDVRPLAERNVNPQLMTVNLLRRASVAESAP